MRTMDPAIVRSTFDTQIAEALDFYRALRPKLDSDSQATKLSALTLMTAATIWESFISDLFIAYINRDPSKFVLHLENALKSDMSSKQRQIQSRYAPFRSPTSIDKSTIASLVDENGNNITFPNATALKKRARLWITDANGAGIQSLSKQQLALIDLWIALRNHIAHDSERSRNALQDQVSNGALYGTGLHRQKNAIHRTGVYLKSLHQQPNGNPRVEIIVGHMQAIGLTL